VFLHADETVEETERLKRLRAAGCERHHATRRDAEHDGPREVVDDEACVHVHTRRVA
jgi:hypothetical protein